MVQASLREVENTIQRVGSKLIRLENSAGARIVTSYLFYGARHIHELGLAFLDLKKLERDYAAKMLLRPAIEVTIKSSAVLANPLALVRICYSEENDDRKWLSAIQPEASKADDLDTITQAKKEEFARNFAAEYPEHDFESLKKLPGRIDLAELATIGGKSHIYQILYRTHCRYSHGNLSGLTDHYADVLDDCFVMGVCMELAEGFLDFCISIPSLQAPGPRQYAKPTVIEETFPNTTPKFPTS